MHARRWAQLKGNTHAASASQRREQYDNMMQYFMHCGSSGYCLQLLTSGGSCGAGARACTGITCRCSCNCSRRRVASAVFAVPVTFISAAAAVVGCLLLILRVSKLLAHTITVVPVLTRKSSLPLHKGQHCQVDVCKVWLQPSCSERSDAKCSMPHELHYDTAKLSASLLSVEEIALLRLVSTSQLHIKLWLQ
jgi:hypothetical protein